METVEIVVYMSIAIMVGVLFIGFITGFDFQHIGQELHKVFFGSEKSSFEKVPTDEFGQSLLSFWESCNEGGTSLNATFYVDGEGAVDKAVIFAPLKKYNLCYTLQSAEQDCGYREDVVLPEGGITAPALLRATCDSVYGTLNLTVVG